MFNKLKESIKKAVSFLTKREEENDSLQETQELTQEKTKKENTSKKPKKEKKTQKKEKKENKKETNKAIKESQKETPNKVKQESQEPKKNQKKFSEKEFEKLFEEFELMLLEANVSLEVIEIIKEKLKENLLNKKGSIKKIFEDTLIETIESIVKQVPQIDLFSLIKKKKPFVILFIGVNGSGKTTSIAKVCKMLMSKGLSVVIAAADTFRAASIEQLKHHGSQLGVKVIAHQYGSDPAAVAYDAIQYAKTHGIDVVLIDSAGRLHTNVNLMKELEKVKRVSNADLTLLVIDALTGHDAIDQVKEFMKIGFDGIVITKYDADDKGGTILSVIEISKKPIVFVGTGQGYEDLEVFNPDSYLDEIFGGE